MSSCVLPESSTLSRGGHPIARNATRLTPWLLAAAYLAAHLFVLAPSLEDIDSINFALGLRHFDPAEHQPHPPGYPIYIAAGRASLALVNAVRPGVERVAAEALALSIWSVIAGALAIVFAWRLFDGLAANADEVVRGRVRLWGSILLAACPLFWLTGVRPMSDMPGLAIALAAQALLLRTGNEGHGRARAGAFLAGLALGVRSQTLWLTSPLLVVDLLGRRATARGRLRACAEQLLFAALGALCWAVPLIVATGGLGAYMAALGTQAGEDFAFVDMLWANPTPRRFAFGLLHTFVLPWGSVPLAVIVLALALIGAVLLLARDRRALVLLVVAFGPYTVFHLVFQETVTVRYALPAVVPIAFLAARVFAAAGAAANIVATPVAVLLLLSAIPATAAYAREPHPAFRAIVDAVRRAEVDPPAMVTSHFELRRPLRVSEHDALPIVFAPLQREWLELDDYWAGGGRGPVWFFANPRRTDLALIDPHSRRDVVRYHWSVASRPELSGTRPADVDWYRLRPPGWFLGEGWSLTPETGGVAIASGAGPDHRPIIGYVRRRAVPMHALVGGRHLGEAGDAPVQFEMALDGAVIDHWTLTPQESNFLRFVDLPGGVPGAEGEYARLTISAHAAGNPGPSVRVPPVAIRQFDIQPASEVIFGFGPGWHEQEYDGATGSLWRWASDRAVLQVRAPAQSPVRVRIRGESPLRYFDEAPTVTLSAGGRAIASLRPSADWEWDVVVPADALAAGHGEMALATDHVFVPAEIMDSPDARRLSLRILALDVVAAR